jgi:ATP-dependent DNA ligase
MTRAFTTATDSSLINLIQGARTRLALIAPALTAPVARALAARMADVFLYAFDLLELNGEDLREEPFELRKGKLERLLAHSSSGLRLVEHMEGDGPIIFRHACKLKLEGTVSKRKDLGYRSGPSKRWLKTKNPKAPAAMRLIEEGTW